MFSSCEDPDEEKPSRRNIFKNTKYFSVSFYCILTWRKSSQSHWKARDIMFSLIVNLDVDRIQKKSHITSKQAFEKLRVPTHGQSKELTLYTACPLPKMPRRKPCLLFQKYSPSSQLHLRSTSCHPCRTNL